MSWLYKAAFGTAEPSFEPQTVTFGRKSIQTTALLAEGGYSFVYSAREEGVASQPRQFAVKQVLAQDDETLVGGASYSSETTDRLYLGPHPHHLPLRLRLRHRHP